MERRPLFLIAESDLNDPEVIRPRIAGGYGIDAQWCDDVHHALWATLSGERQGYYDDFGAAAGAREGAEPGRSCTTAAGRASASARTAAGPPAPRRRSSSPTCRTTIRSATGRSATGPRRRLSDGLLCAGAALLLLSPFTPMLFMGEEWGARTPWQFFSDHAAELGRAVSEGRRREFAEHGWTTARDPRPAGPGDVRRRRSWTGTSRGTSRGRRLLQWYQQLIALRRAEPALTEQQLGQARFHYDEIDCWFVVWRGHPDGDSVAVAVNLADHAAGRAGRRVSCC